MQKFDSHIWNYIKIQLYKFKSIFFDDDTATNPHKKSGKVHKIYAQYIMIVRVFFSQTGICRK